MTKEKFIRIQKNRGYEVEDFGKMVTLSMNDSRSHYTAIWFFNADGSVDENNPPTWHVSRP